VNSLPILASEVVRPKTDADKAAELQKLGISSFDALHLACAERGEVDMFSHDRCGLLSRVRRHGTELRVEAENPLVQGTGEITLLEEMSAEDFERHALAILQGEAFQSHSAADSLMTSAGRSFERSARRTLQRFRRKRVISGLRRPSPRRL